MANFSWEHISDRRKMIPYHCLLQKVLPSKSRVLGVHYNKYIYAEKNPHGIHMDHKHAHLHFTFYTIQIYSGTISGTFYKSIYETNNLTIIFLHIIGFTLLFASHFVGFTLLLLGSHYCWLHIIVGVTLLLASHYCCCWLHIISVVGFTLLLASHY